MADQGDMSWPCLESAVVLKLKLWSIQFSQICSNRRERETEPPGRLWGWSASVLSRQHRYLPTRLNKPGALIPLLPTLDFLMIVLEKGGVKHS